MEIKMEKIYNITCLNQYDKNKYNNQLECSICLNDFENNENILILPCIHIFHENCLKEWFKKRSTCPLDNKNYENDLK